jgi:hypothetical protein
MSTLNIRLRAFLLPLRYTRLTPTAKSQEGGSGWRGCALCRERAPYAK